MGTLKFKPDQLFTGKEFAPANSVLITDTEGKVEAILPSMEAGADLQELEGILCPGFINAHCHLELSHLKGIIPAGTGMINFLLSVMQQRNSGAALKEAAMAEAESHMLETGIVAVGDICNTSESMGQKLQKNLRYYNFIECSGFVPEKAAERFTTARAVLERMRSAGPCRIVPHAPYSVSPELFQLINEAAEGIVSTIHNQESVPENEFFQTGGGEFQKLFAAIGVDISFYRAARKSSLQAVLPYMNNCSKLILVHNTYISKTDFQFISNQKTDSGPALFFCLCPNANLYINNILPPVELLLSETDQIVLGTDSLASNTQLSIFEEINTLKTHFPELSWAQLLRWATFNGAAALGLEESLGSFDKNKIPGLVQINKGLSRRIL